MTGQFTSAEQFGKFIHFKLKWQIDVSISCKIAVFRNWFSCGILTYLTCVSWGYIQFIFLFFFDKLRDRKFQFQFQMLIKKPPQNKTHSKIVINEFVFSKKKSVANKFNPNGVNNPLKISLERKNAKRNEIIINLQKFKKN